MTDKFLLTNIQQPVYKCCREIRIQTPNVLGNIYYGLNTLTDTHEVWKCIKIDPDNYNNNIMGRLLKEDLCTNFLDLTF